MCGGGSSSKACVCVCECVRACVAVTSGEGGCIVVAAARVEGDRSSKGISSRGALAAGGEALATRGRGSSCVGD